MITSSLRSVLFGGLSDLLYPPFCRLCDGRLATGETVFCCRCLSDLHETDLGNWLDHVTFRDGLDSALTGWFFDERMQQVIHALKYDEMVIVGKVLGERLGTLLKRTISEMFIDVLAPVPLHPVRLRERGYNQSEILAKGLSYSLAVPLASPLLKRHRYTESQTNLTAEERVQNVADAFVLKGEPPERILLVDDVLTTGSTASACAIALKEAGARFVAVLTAGTPYFHRP